MGNLRDRFDEAVHMLERYQHNKNYIPNNRSDPALYGWVTPKSTNPIQYRVCHRELSGAAPEYVVEPHHHVEDLGKYLEGLKILLNPDRSPWRTLLPFVTEHEKGIIISGDAPANLAVSFLVAKRTILYEYEHQTVWWWKLIDQGIDPYVALMLAHGMQFSNFPCNFMWPHGHCFIDQCTNAERFLNGDVHHLKGPLRTHSYYPVNQIFYGSRNGGQWQQNAYLTDLRKRHPNLISNKGQWNENFRIPSAEAFTDFVKQEGEVLAACIHHGPDVRGGVVDLQVS